MLTGVFPIIAPIFACVAVGYVWKLLKQPFDSQMISRLVIMVGAPALIISTLDKAPIAIPLLQKMALVCFALLAIFLIVGAVCLKLLALDVRGYVGTLAFPNVGNMGLPLCLFAFGDKGLSLGLAFFMLISVVHFSFGILLFAGGSWLKAFTNNPIIYSVAAGIFMIYTDTELPEWAARSLDLIGSFTIPMMLIALGASLAGLRVAYFKDSLILSLLRLALGLGAGWLVTEFMGLTGIERGVVILQAAMPTAVFNYMFANQYQRNSQQVAGMVLISTLISFVSLPWLLLWAKGQL